VRSPTAPTCSRRPARSAHSLNRRSRRRVGLCPLRADAGAEAFRGVTVPVPAPCRFRSSPQRAPARPVFFSVGNPARFGFAPDSPPRWIASGPRGSAREQSPCSNATSAASRARLSTNGSIVVVRSADTASIQPLESTRIDAGPSSRASPCGSCRERCLASPRSVAPGPGRGFRPPRARCAWLLAPARAVSGYISG
jgi:hypothetical protein